MQNAILTFADFFLVLFLSVVTCGQILTGKNSIKRLAFKTAKFDIKVCKRQSHVCNFGADKTPTLDFVREQL